MGQDIENEDEHEKETLQSDAETVMKVMINEVYLAERCEDWQGTQVSSRT